MPSAITQALTDKFQHKLKPWILMTLSRFVEITQELHDLPYDLTVEETRQALINVTREKQYHDEEQLAEAQEEAKLLKGYCQQDWAQRYDMEKSAYVKRHLPSSEVAAERDRLKELVVKLAELQSKVKTSVGQETVNYGINHLQEMFEYEYADRSPPSHPFPSFKEWKAATLKEPGKAIKMRKQQLKQHNVELARQLKLFDEFVAEINTLMPGDE